MAKYIWVYDPQSGGIKIPPKQYEIIKQRLIKHLSNIAPNVELEIKFKAQFCYVNTIENKQSMPVCRMRHFSTDKWSFSFYTYSNEKYSPCKLSANADTGTVEEILNCCTMYFN